MTKGEVLALQLAQRAGIDAAEGRIVHSEGSPVAIIRRFDRTSTGTRIPYLSAASMLQAQRDDIRSYTELADSINANCFDPKHDLAELWRRIVFNLLITNVDDHLHNHGFLHLEHGHWRLAPAFDLNPFPDKDQELKTWLSEDGELVDDIGRVMQISERFGLRADDATRVLGDVFGAIQLWAEVAAMPEVGMTPREVDDFVPAFDHKQMKLAAKLLGITHGAGVNGKRR